MKLFARAIFALAALFCAPALADQPSITIPTTSAPFFAGGNQPTWNNAGSLYLNPALRGLASNFSGPNCATGVQAPVPYQWCAQTSSPRTMYLYVDGAWVPAFGISGTGLTITLPNGTVTGP